MLVLTVGMQPLQLIDSKAITEQLCSFFLCPQIIILVINNLFLFESSFIYPYPAI